MHFHTQIRHIKIDIKFNITSINKDLQGGRYETKAESRSVAIKENVSRSLRHTCAMARRGQIVNMESINKIYVAGALLTIGIV